MARNYFKGTYTPLNRHKYQGVKDPTYRSSWEHLTFKWLDLNADVVAWTSEMICIPYLCETDGQIHRYYIDLAIKYKSGNSVLVEIKPISQSKPPKRTGRKSQETLLEEHKSWLKNKSKWKAADAFAQKHGMVFQVWTEETLNAIGILIK